MAAKVLVLGTMESGKTTFVEQMKIIYGEGFSEEERLEFREIIFHNVLKSAKILAEARRRLQIPFENPSNDSFSAMLPNYCNGPGRPPLPEEFQQYVMPLKAFWVDSGIQTTFRRRNDLVCVCMCVLGIGGRKGR